MSQTVALKNEPVEEVEQSPQEEQQPRGSRFYAYYVVFVLFAATMLNALDSNVFTSAAPVIARELHMNISSIGVLTSAFTIFLTVSIIPVGLWADRTKRSYVIAACLAVWSLATAFTALAGNFFSLFVTRMFTGIGEAGYMPAGNSLVADFFHKGQRPKILSLLALATLIGAIGGIVAGGVIAGLGPGTWHLAFLITGLPGLLLALCAWRLREPARRRQKIEAAAAYSGLRLSGMSGQLRGLISSKVFICTTIYGVLVEFTAVGLQAYFPTLLQQRDTLGLTSGQAATFAGLALGPTALVGILFGGYLASWLRRRYRSANFLTCVVTTMITAPLNLTTLLVLITTHNLVLFTIVMLPSFLINTIHIGPLSAAVLDIAPADQRASTVAIFLFIVRILGTALAPLVIGFLANGFDPGGQHFAHSLAGHDLTLALLITCPIAFTIASIAGVIGLRLMRRQHEALA